MDLSQIEIKSVMLKSIHLPVWGLKKVAFQIKRLTEKMNLMSQVDTIHTLPLSLATN